MIPHPKLALPAAIAFSTLAMLTTSVTAGPSARTTATARSKTRKPTVAVLYFTYDGADKELIVLRKGLAEMLIGDLAEVDAVRVVERTRLEALLKELKLNRSRKIDPKSANRVGKLLGAHYLVWGSYFKTFGTFCLTGKVIEVERGLTLPGGKACGKPADFLTLYQKVSQSLRGTLETRLHAAPGRKVRKVRKARRRGHVRRRRHDEKSAITKNHKRTRHEKGPTRLTTRTALAYARALDAKDRGDLRVARNELTKLLRHQPDFHQAKLLLASLK